MPGLLKQSITAAYTDLCEQAGQLLKVAVRSSATAEDLPGASFAGQQETYLNISGPESVVNAYKLCLASLFTERAIKYRFDQGFKHMDVALSVGVQQWYVLMQAVPVFFLHWNLRVVSKMWWW